MSRRGYYTGGHGIISSRVFIQTSLEWLRLPANRSVDIFIREVKYKRSSRTRKCPGLRGPLSVSRPLVQPSRLTLNSRRLHENVGHEMIRGGRRYPISKLAH